MNKFYYVLILPAVLFCNGCVDLDIRPNSNIILPTTAADFERLLNHDAVTATPALPHLHADEHLLNDYVAWQNLFRVTQKRSYTWEHDLYGGEEGIADWNTPYQGIFHCNNVLDHIEILNMSPEYNSIKGWALFARAYLFYGLLCSFGATYEPTTAETALGIPLKLSSGIDDIRQRATVQACYDQIIKDALLAETLIEQPVPSGNRNRPSKAAVYAFLARLYLGIGDYAKAEEYAERTLSLFDELTDFNTLDTLSANPFTYNSAETIYFSRQVYGYITNGNLPFYHINPELLSLYEAGDLRRHLYFVANNTGGFWIKPINTFVGLPFTGLAVDEMYLIKAECLARRNDPAGSVALLNTLLGSRYEQGKFIRLVGNTAHDALALVLLERRKSLIYRCQRWEDLKRLNREGYDITLSRELNGVTYTLPPNDPRYTFPIPDDEIARSGVEQNSRK